MNKIIFGIYLFTGCILFTSCKKDVPTSERRAAPTLPLQPPAYIPPPPPPNPNFNPFSGGTLVGNLSSPKYEMTSVVCNNKFLFAGGLTDQYKINDVVDIFDPQTNSSSITHLSIPRIDLSATATSTHAFFAGGAINNSNNAVPVTRIDIYNTINNSWSIAELSEARYGIGSATVSNKVLFAGGSNGSGFTSRVDIFDVITNSWSTAQLSEARTNISAAVIGNKIFFAGGTGSNGSSKRVDIYEVSTNSWSTGDLSVPHGHLNAAVINNKIYFAGDGVMEVFDNAINKWATIPLPFNRKYIIPLGISNNKIAFIGGQLGQWNYSSEIVIFDPATSGWTSSYIGNYQGMILNGQSIISYNNYIYSAGGSWFDGYFYEPVISEIFKFHL